MALIGTARDKINETLRVYKAIYDDSSALAGGYYGGRKYNMDHPHHNNMNIFWLVLKPDRWSLQRCQLNKFGELFRVVTHIII